MPSLRRRGRPRALTPGAAANSHPRWRRGERAKNAAIPDDRPATRRRSSAARRRDGALVAERRDPWREKGFGRAGGARSETVIVATRERRRRRIAPWGGPKRVARPSPAPSGNRASAPFQPTRARAPPPRRTPRRECGDIVQILRSSTNPRCCRDVAKRAPGPGQSFGHCRIELCMGVNDVVERGRVACAASCSFCDGQDAGEPAGSGD